MTYDPVNKLGKVLDKRYRILRYLGGGGFGYVYLAYDQDLHDEVALKFPKDPSLNQGIVREARTMHKLEKCATSGHVVKFNALINVDGKQTLVTEYCGGGALSDHVAKSSLLRAKAPLPASTVCRIAAQVCKGLEDAHAINCVHRDIKPENIFLSDSSIETAVVKLGDFGIAKILETHLVTRIGTKCYMAPEILNGKGADLRSDVYSLGVTMYELLTGTMPHDQSLGDYPLMKAIIDGDITPLSKHPHVDKRLWRIVGRAMQVDPAARYARASDLLADIEEAQVDLAIDAELANTTDGQSGADAALKSQLKLEELCREFPEVRRPYLELAQLHRRQGRSAKAIEVYQMALSRFGQDPRLLSLLAQSYASTEKYFSAVGAMEQALDMSTSPNDAPMDRLSPKEIDSFKKLIAAWKRVGSKS